MRFILPLGIFILMVGLLGFGLTLDPKKIPSPLIDKLAPNFSLSSLYAPEEKLVACTQVVRNLGCCSDPRNVLVAHKIVRAHRDKVSHRVQR